MKQYLLAATIILTALTVCSQPSNALGNKPKTPTVTKEQTLPKNKATENKTDTQQPKTNTTQATAFYITPQVRCLMDNINKHYQNALNEIATSSMPQDTRQMLAAQAEENHALAIKQLKEKAEMCAKHACQRLKIQDNLNTETNGIKTIEKVDNI